jgi:hypothetical protein
MSWQKEQHLAVTIYAMLIQYSKELLKKKHMTFAEFLDNSLLYTLWH